MTLTSGPLVLTARLENLSRSGMFASTVGRASEALLATAVDINLRLDGQEAAWLAASGRVARIDVDGIAISFATISEELAAVIDEMGSQADMHARTLSVVLIDGDVARNIAMVEGFRAAGCRVMHVSTPLEAIVRLGESSFEPDLVAIADTSGTSADELHTFVERNHPRARLIAIGTDPGREATSAWLSSEDPLNDLPARVLHVLGTPRRT